MRAIFVAVLLLFSTISAHALTIDGQNGTVIQSCNETKIIIRNSSNITIDDCYVSGSPDHSIVIENSQGVTISNTLIENWGSEEAGGFGGQHHGIYVIGGSDHTISRNTIRNPNADTNSWEEYHPNGWRCDVTWPDRCHPRGPHGMFFQQTDGGHLIEYNEIYSDNGNYYNDGIGGGWNFQTGNLRRNSIVHGNIVSQVWDDAIEVEGDNENIIISGNYIEAAHVAIAVSPVFVGPVEIFNNVVIYTDYSPFHSDCSGVFIKAKDQNGSMVDVHHNSVLCTARGITSWGGGLPNWSSYDNAINASVAAEISGPGDNFSPVFDGWVADSGGAPSDLEFGPTAYLGDPPPPPPDPDVAILSVSPDTVPKGKTTYVTVTGTGFTGQTVTLTAEKGPQPSYTYQIISDTEIEVAVTTKKGGPRDAPWTLRVGNVEAPMWLL